MKGLTTKEAFGKVINTPGIHHRLGMNESTVRSLRKEFNDDGSITLDKMEAVLSKLGCVVVQEKLWSVPLEQ